MPVTVNGSSSPAFRRENNNAPEGHNQTTSVAGGRDLDQLPEYKIEVVLAYLQGVFDGVSETPNEETIAAFKEIEEGGGHLFTGSTEDLFAEMAED